MSFVLSSLVYPFIHLPFYLSIYWPKCIYVCIYLPIYFIDLVYPFTCLLAYLSVYLSVHFSMYSICMYVCIQSWKNKIKTQKGQQV